MILSGDFWAEKYFLTSRTSDLGLRMKEQVLNLVKCLKVNPGTSLWSSCSSTWDLQMSLNCFCCGHGMGHGHQISHIIFDNLVTQTRWKALFWSTILDCRRILLIQLQALKLMHYKEWGSLTAVSIPMSPIRSRDIERHGGPAMRAAECLLGRNRITGLLNVSWQEILEPKMCAWWTLMALIFFFASLRIRICFFRTNSTES